MLLAKTLTSSTFKTALIGIATFGTLAISLFVYVYISTASYLRGRSDRAITAEFSTLKQEYERSGRDGLLDLIQRRTAGNSHAGGVYLLLSPSSTVIAGNLRQWPAGMPSVDGGGWVEFRASEPLSNATSRPLVRGVLEQLPDGDRLLVGMDISDLDGLTRRIRAAVISAIAMMFAIAAAASILVARRTVGRIEQINATSRAIMLSSLDKRIPLRGTNDEWDRVAENLNLMLDRIETLMGEVKQVSDNVAHDLRTPLTRMRGRLEKAYHSLRIAEDDQALIGDTIGDLDAVLRIFSSITRIAQIEAQARQGAFRAVNLVEVASEVVELYDAAAEQDGTRLTLAGDREVLVTGDRDLLFDAIANLVDNAIKHGRRPGGHVVVTSENGGSGPVISIADDGPGIPEKQHERVFKRFYRLEQSRYTPGNGLGLSLVAAVARLHGARIEMLDNSPGLQFKLWFSAPSG